MNNETPVTELTFEQAQAELDGILTRLRNDNVQVDQLVALTRRGAELIRECKSRLTMTEKDLAKVLESLESIQD